MATPSRRERRPRTLSSSAPGCRVFTPHAHTPNADRSSSFVANRTDERTEQKPPTTVRTDVGPSTPHSPNHHRPGRPNRPTHRTDAPTQTATHHCSPKPSAPLAHAQPPQCRAAAPTTGATHSTRSGTACPGSGATTGKGSPVSPENTKILMARAACMSLSEIHPSPIWIMASQELLICGLPID
ncbi:hypothetical protein BRADI_1g06638v3 [Brachypodium distachyon]|uniref:Uncharacterized protein n=1 Tax=Brachypodium distachyon TaxID=15368 RepID=A0A2K2DIE0_BRADI|nr:hypothetical protein BRADI_1g06638v3 [Brachypodium distachyon]